MKILSDYVYSFSFRAGFSGKEDFSEELEEEELEVKVDDEEEEELEVKEEEKEPEEEEDSKEEEKEPEEEEEPPEEEEDSIVGFIFLLQYPAPNSVSGAFPKKFWKPVVNSPPSLASSLPVSLPMQPTTQYLSFS
jgi:hypothetical protein